MAHPSLSLSSAPQSSAAGRGGPPSPDRPETANATSNYDPGKAIASLRVEIGRPDCDANAALQRITETARSVTAANGAAIALRQAEDVICQARAGALAPPLGAKLDASSGISGDCLRSARPVRCEDTTKDVRVDPQVREYLGLWSLAAVPIVDGADVIGILEVFSALPYSFSLPHLELLEELAGLAAALQPGSPARVTQQDLNETAIAAKTGVRAPHRGRAFLWDRVGRLMQSEREMLLHLARTRPGQQKLVISGIAALTISLALGWILGYTGPPSRPPLARRSAPTRPFPATSAASSAALSWSASSAAAGKTPSAIGSPASPLVMAGQREKLGKKAVTAIRARRVPAAAAPSDTEATSSPVSSGSDTEAENTPTLLAASPRSENPLGAVLSAPATIPEAALNVSAGLTRGEVVHRVQPIYPPQARTAGLEGSVVLQATVSENGKVNDVKVISGPPLLARAAESAVARWRYRPFLLNGKPIVMRTEITLEFKLPSH